MNNTFFSHIAKNGFFEKWAPALDWYLSSEHFKNEKWKDYISVFTKEVKRISYLKRIEIKYGIEGKMNYPRRRPNSIRVVLTQTSEDSKSVGKDLVRHIRNGIAHGRARFTKIGDNSYIEIQDYKDDNQTKQTAYILFPKDCIISIYEVYLNVAKRVEKSSK